MTYRPVALLLLPLLAAAASPTVSEKSPGDQLTPAEALEALQRGNLRYRESHSVHPNQSMRRRIEVSSAQHPFAQILTCSDSRVSPEIIFDEGLGDLFVVRVAGNVVDEAIKGTLEYGAGHLGVPLIVVMGHSGCGAVAAAAHTEEAHDHIVSLMDAIFPAVLEAREQPGDLVENSVRENVRRWVAHLRRSWPTLYRMHGNGEIAIVGAVYDLRTGTVEWLDAAPVPTP